MSLSQSIAHGRERRRPYYGRQAFDASCRPGGNCPCRQGPSFSRRRGEMDAAEQILERAQLCAPESYEQNRIDAHEAETEERRLMRLMRFAAEVLGP